MKRKHLETAAIVLALTAVLALTSCNHVSTEEDEETQLPNAAEEMNTEENEEPAEPEESNKPRLSKMTDAECVEFIRDAGVELPPSLSEWSDEELGAFVKKVIRTAEAYPRSPPWTIFSYDDSRDFVEKIGNIVNEYYTDKPRLSEMTEDECVEFIRDAGVEIPSELSHLSADVLGKMVKNAIVFSERYPGEPPGGGVDYTFTRDFTNEIGLVVYEYYTS